MSVRAAAASALLAAASLAALAGCGGGGGDERPDPEAVVAVTTDYAHAFGRGDGETACSLLTPGARDSLVARVSSLVGTRDCAEAVQKLQSLAGPNVTGQFRTAKASSPTVTDDKATATLTAGGHATQVTLEKRDGDWLLTRAPGL
jgi:predicted small lipoprotein YifL